MEPPEQSDRLRSLACLARAVACSAPLLELLESACEEALTALGAASVSVSRLEQAGTRVRTLLNAGDLGPTEERWPENEVYEIADYANLRGVTDDNRAWTIQHDDPTADQRELELLRELGKGSAVGAPLIVDGALWGEFYATRLVEAPAYSVDEMAYLEALCAIIAGAVSRAEREETLWELAYHDALTGLLNRRALSERSAAILDNPAEDRPVTVVMVDINGLKQVNDARGHQAGDRLIKSVAAALSHQFDPFPGALVARVGGDEFTVLVPDRPAATVIAAADELCTTSWGAGAVANVSCGAATLDVRAGQGVDPDMLFAAADRAQYVAKRARLRRTVLDEEYSGPCENMGA